MNFYRMITRATLVVGTFFSVATVEAQMPERTVSLLIGGFSYDYASDQTFPAASVRLDQRLSRYLIAEGNLSYARAKVDVVDHSPPDPTSREEKSNLTAATVGVQVELPLGSFRPYVGIATGIFGRFDQGGGDRFLRTTTAFPLGFRVAISDRLMGRGEARLRFDEHQGGDSAADAEVLVGFGWRF